MDFSEGERERKRLRRNERKGGKKEASTQTSAIDPQVSLPVDAAYNFFCLILFNPNVHRLC